MNEYLKLKHSLFIYLKRIGMLQPLQNKALEFKELALKNKINIDTNFYFPVYINMVELCEISDFIVYKLLTEPMIVQEALNKVIYIALLSAFNETHKNGKMLQLNQIIAPIKIDIIVKDSKYLASGLCHVHGIIVEHSRMKKIIRTTKWICQNEHCSKSRPLILNKIPNKTPECIKCCTQTEEILPNEEDIGNVIYIKVIEANFISSNQHNVRSWIVGRIEDSRVNIEDIKLGNEVDLIGIRSTSYLDVWGLENARSEVNTNFRNVDNLRIRFQNSPWAFVQALAGIIGRSILPSDCYMHLRMGLILSLASTCDAPPIPLLIVCKDGNIAELMMQDAMQLASKCLQASSLTCLGPKAEEWQSAGTILLGSKGVLYLGEWVLGNKYKVVKDSIESGMVMNGSNGASLPLTTAMWTYIQNEPRNRKLQNELETLKQVFGFAWNAEIDSSFEEDVVDLMLSTRVVGSTDDLPTNEVQAYIKYVQTISVVLSDGANDLLQKYFVCSRQCRGTSLPLKSLDPIIALTKAHARLKQCNIANKEDALVAIEFCEKSLDPRLDIPLPPVNTWEFQEWLEEHFLSTIIDLNSMDVF